LGNPEVRYTSKLRTIQPMPDRINNAVFFNALFDVPNPNRTLWTDMTVEVTFVLSELKEVLAIPLTALGSKGEDGRYEVSILNNDKTITKRLIRTGLSDDMRVQVLDGLKAGEIVIVGEYPGPSGKI
jgi:macrolide-specific efflux system membrane fusion protein